MDGSAYLETEEAKAYLSQARNRAFEKNQGDAHAAVREAEMARQVEAMRETLLADLADEHLEPEALADLESKAPDFPRVQVKGFQIKTLPGLFCWLLAILLLAGPVGAQQPPAQVGGELPEKAVRQIKAMLTTKAQRTDGQRKVSSQLGELATPGHGGERAAATGAGRRRRPTGGGPRWLTRTRTGIRTGDCGHPGRCDTRGAGPHPDPGRHGDQQRAEIPGHPGATPAG